MFEQTHITPEKRHILTVSIEDYFHVGAFQRTVQPRHWERFEPRLERNLKEVLELLDRYGVKATFFVLGCIADRQPEIVQMIAKEGHEIASSGYWPRGLKGMVADEFRENLHRTKIALEKAGAQNVVGFRAPRDWLTEKDRWVLDVLAEEGYIYDSSINPIFRRFAKDPYCFEVHRYRHSTGNLTLWEFPISTMSLLGCRIAISGGNYIRQLPHTILSRAVSRWDRTKESPLIFYFMPWEIDKEQPKIQNISRFNRIRHYRNLAKTRWVLECYLQKYRFQPIQDYLGLSIEKKREEIEPSSVEIYASQEKIEEEPIAERIPVTIVIPLFNEEQTLPYLQRTLNEIQKTLGKRYEIHFNLVDDGSTDHTWEDMEKRFSGMKDCKRIRHLKNAGITAAIMTGIQNADTEMVCSMDCDCSYDPNDFSAMIPLLENADLVTASPYHPKGNVFRVPSWRLFLSKTLSRLYSLLLKERFYTFTSCFRVYRKSIVENIQPGDNGFLGIAEMLILLKSGGARIVEFPTTLESRMFGESKMKVMRTIRKHLGLLIRLAVQKISEKWRQSYRKAVKRILGVYDFENMWKSFNPYPRRSGNKTGGDQTVARDSRNQEKPPFSITSGHYGSASGDSRADLRIL